MAAPAALLLCVAYVLLASVAVSLIYHRVLTHRVARLAPWFEYSMVTLGLPAGTPIQWVGNHRRHHAHTDQEGDPHSPRDGVWHAHNGWYLGRKHWVPCLAYALAGPFRTLLDGWMRPRTNQESAHLAPDVAAIAYYRFVSRPEIYLAFALAHVGLFYGAAYGLGGWLGCAWLYGTQVLVYNLGDGIDSLSHVVGERPFRGEHLATNHWLLAFLTFGEGWHATHHTFPQSPRTDLLRGHVDVVWWQLSALAWLGIATQIKPTPKPDVIRSRMTEIDAHVLASSR